MIMFWGNSMWGLLVEGEHTDRCRTRHSMENGTVLLLSL